MEELYEWIETCLSGSYSVSYQMMDTSEIGNLGIFLYPGGNDSYDLEGGTIYESISIHLQLQTDKSSTSIFEGLKSLRESVDNIENSNGSTNVAVMSCAHKGPKSYMVGLNEHSLPLIVSNLDLRYAIN